jgi:hypothetical protein
MRTYEVSDHWLAIQGTLPGVSRTITVEPIRVPRVPTLVPEVRPDRNESDPSREPITPW